MNESLRQQLQYFLAKNGIKKSHVAKVMHVHKSFITHFLKGRTGMSVENSMNLKLYLDRGVVNEKK